jgi:hypothetical protein
VRKGRRAPPGQECEPNNPKDGEEAVESEIESGIQATAAVKDDSAGEEYDCEEGDGKELYGVSLEREAEGSRVCSEI